jgi:hypothetical protein
VLEDGGHIMTTTSVVPAAGEAETAVSTKIPPEMLPFILAGTLTQLGYRAEGLWNTKGREDELLDMARDAGVLADWCSRMHDQVQWRPSPSDCDDDEESLLMDARTAAVQLAGVALLLASDSPAAMRVRASLSKLGDTTSCPLGNALMEVAGRCAEFGRGRAVAS